MKKEVVQKFLKDSEKYLKQEQSEKSIEDAFVSYVKKKGGLALKLSILGRRGFLDRSVLVPGGRVFFIEFKRPGKRTHTTAGQEKWIGVLRGLGFSCFVCDSLKEAKAIYDDFISNRGV